MASFPNNFYCAAAFSRTDHIRGGTVIFVHKNVNARKFDVSEYCLELHFEICAIAVDELKLIVISLYHSTAGNADTFLLNLDKLLSSLCHWSSYTVVIGGDVNISFDITSTRQSAKRFLNTLRQYNFYCLNRSPTRGNHCLDNVFVNCHSKVVKSSVVFEFPFSDHDGVMIELDRLVTQNECILWEGHSYLKFFLPKESIPDLISHLNTYVWKNLLFNNVGFDSDKTFGLFFQILINNLNYYQVNKKKKSNNNGKNKNKSWYNNDLRDLKNRLLFLNSIVKHSKSPDTSLLYAFSCLKKNYKSSIQKAKLNYNTTYINRSSNKCKAAWHVIKNNCQNSTKSAKINISPNALNNYFIDSVTDIKLKIGASTAGSQVMSKNNVTGPTSVLFSWTPVTTGSVLEATKRLNNSNSLDVYNISNSLLKKLMPSIVEPLTVCINMCLEEGVFPRQLKVSRVCPVFKNGPKDKPSSYRPISVIPIISKIFEILVYDQISNFLEGNNIISISQYGFRKGKSTVDAMDKLVRKILQSFENKAYAQATLCDLSKAFDCVNHSDLLKKLSHYGVQGSPLSFLKSYLNKRTQKVCINGDWSQEAQVQFGVPQGSVLGPLLFIVCINDLPNAVQASTFLYADDTTFFNSSDSLYELTEFVKNTMNAASLWFNANGFLMNDSKTQNILFTLKPIPAGNLNSTVNDSVKLLGIVIDSNLKWGSHIDFLLTKLSRITYLLSRLVNCVNDSYIRTAYFGYFQSVVRYGLILWGNSVRINEILVLQKKTIRIICKSNFLDHCKPLFINLKILTVVNLYIFDLTIYVLNNEDLLNYASNKHSYNTRQKDNVLINFYRLNKSTNSHVVLALKVYNKLKTIINKYTLKNFKTNFYNWLIKNPFYALVEFFSIDDIVF